MVVPSREELLPVSTGQRCFFCADPEWVWVYLLRQLPEWVQRLDWWINWQIALCDRCHQDYLNARDDALAQAWLDHQGSDESKARQVVEVVRARQSEPPIARSEAIVPGVTEVIATGFTPVENLTGMLEVALVWPEDHRRSIPEVRPWALADERLQGQLWLVRSPWPGLTLDDVFLCLWSVVDKYRDPNEGLSAAGEVLCWPESRAQEQRAVVRSDLDPQ
jgi:hypothetical protein